MSTREVLARVISDHQLTGRISIGCTACPGLEFMTSVEHAEHVADMIAEQFLVVPQGEVVGLEYAWEHRGPSGVNRWGAADAEVARLAARARRFVLGEGLVQPVFRSTLAWSPLPENGEQP
ncbi:hypothetical protein [Nocardia abscessus]|uniref:hypothetical protein n=1 Tax=Nocardia abscessus TaxID=120957 RepID=UPI0002E4222E|nr:hypothetical protein [Nocardia abscessus]MCC3333561.1 hypothetical protein [Nocardia abscessus]